MSGPKRRVVRESRLSLSAAEFAKRLELGAVFPTLEGASMDQAEAAEAFGISDRQVRSLEDVGLPVDRSSGHPRYPRVASIRWLDVYRHRVRNRCWGGYLSWLDAWREWGRLQLSRFPEDFEVWPRGLSQALQHIQITTSRADLARIRRLLAQAEALNTGEDA